MIIEDLQQILEDIYGEKFSIKAKDYLIGQETLKLMVKENLIDASFLHKNGALFIWEEDNALNLSLYINEKLFDGLQKPLSWSNLQKFCTIAEEISHFYHFLWFWEKKRQTTHLELELLGEIDKYLLCLFFMNLNKEEINTLRQRLFGSFKPVKKISPQQQQRYYDCYCMASKYCRYLEKRFIKDLRLSALLAEVRLFNSLSRSEKISLIARC